MVPECSDGINIHAIQVCPRKVKQSLYKQGCNNSLIVMAALKVHFETFCLYWLAFSCKGQKGGTLADVVLLLCFQLYLLVRLIFIAATTFL